MSYSLADIEAELARRQSGGNPDLSALDAELARRGVQPTAPSMVDQAKDVVGEAASAALETSPTKLTQRFFQTDPAKMQKMAGPAMPIVGGMLGTLATPIAGPAAPVAGAMLGESLNQMAGNALAPETAAKTPLGQVASIAGAGIAQEPKILGAIPGVSKIGEMASGLASKIGRGLAKAGETASGVKADILRQAADQGLSTYGAPSISKAQKIFSDALGPEGQAAMKQTAAEAFDPAVQKARQVATEIGTKLENGETISAIDALKARQATDRVISSTPVTDKTTRQMLYEWRSRFDKSLASQSGKLSDASKTYRQAIVKDKILNPTRITKSGEPSAFLPMLVAHGMMGKGLESGLGVLTGTSPAMWGLGATAGGSVVNGLNQLGSNPAIRQALLKVLQKIQQPSEGQ